MPLDEAAAAPRRALSLSRIGRLLLAGFGLGSTLLSPAIAEERDWTRTREPYFAPLDLDWNDGRWWFTGFAGVVAKNNLSSIVFLASPDFGRSYIAGAMLGREFGAISDALRLEWQAGASAVWGRDDYVDLRFEVGARWIRFPWNEYVFTTAAVMLGPSYVTSISNYELKEGDATHLKNGLTLELTFALPDQPDLAFAWRIHHRSSIFNLIPGAGTPSDFVTLGLKKRF